MKKRILSILLLCCMVLTMLPAPAFAADEEAYALPPDMGGLCEHHPEHDEACGYIPKTAEIPQENEVKIAVLSGTQETVTVESVQAMIDALPEAKNINDDNIEEVKIQFQAVVDAMNQLTVREQNELDISRYMKVSSVLYGPWRDFFNPIPGTDIEWMLSSNDDETLTLTIIGQGEMPDFEDADNQACPWTNSKYAIKRVIIREGVTNIGNYAFSGCAKLAEVHISKTVKKIGTAAFLNCSSLTQIDIPDCVNSVGSFAFVGCTGLKEVHTHWKSSDEINFGLFVFYEYGSSWPEDRIIYVPAGYKANFKSNPNGAWGSWNVQGENYTVSFDGGNASGSMEPVQTSGDYTLPDCSFTYETAVFEYWALENSDGKKAGDAGDVFPVTEDVTFYANWTLVIVIDPDPPIEVCIHEWGEWQSDSNEHWKKCSFCSVVDLGSRRAHDYSDDTDATCIICGYKRTITPPAPTLEPPSYSRQIYSGDFCQLAFSDEYLSGGKATADGETVDGVFTLNEEQEKYGYWNRGGGLVQVGPLALQVTFTPDDLLKYTTAECTVYVDVIPRKFRQANTSYIDNEKIGTAFEDLGLPNAFYFFAEADEPNHEGSGLNANVPGIIEWDDSNYDPNSYEEQTIYGTVNRAEFEKYYIVPEGADLRGVVKVTLQADPVETEIAQPPVFRWKNGDFTLPDNTMFVNRIFEMGATGEGNANLADGVAKVKGTDTVVPGTFSFQVGTPGWFDELGENVVTVVFTPTDQHGYRTAETTIKVNVIKNTFKRCEEPDPITEKKLGTTFAGLNLPQIVVVEAIDGLRVGMEVSWDESSYDAQSTAWQTIPGTLVFGANDEHRYQQPDPAVTAAIRVKLLGSEDAPAITTTTLPGGTVGTPYHHQLQATGGGFILWELFSGELPDGLTLKQTTGEISGTPTAVGTATFTVKAENSVGSGTKELSITIAKPQQYGKVSMGDYVYGETPSTPSLTDWTGDGSVTYYYTTTNFNSNGAKWKNIQADTLNAGTYYMYAELGETENYGSFTTACVEFRVLRAIPTYTKPTGLTAIYGQTLADVTLPNGWSWMNSSESVGNASTAAKKFKAKFTPADITNYNTVEDIELEVTVNKANQAPLTIQGADGVVYGQTLALTTTGGSGSGAVTYRIDTAHSTGEATIDPNTGVLTPVKVGSVSVIATKAGDNDYNDITSAPFVLMIKSAPPTGKPKYTKITTGGKTLKDAALTTEGSTLNPNDGKLEWVDDKGNVLPDSTRVEANKTYKWRFTPTNTNYTILTGEIELYHKSSGGGGSSSGYSYYTIKAAAGTGGSISPSGNVSVREGADQTFTITPDKGYAVANVKIDGKSIGAVKAYTFENVRRNHTIEVSFARANEFIDLPAGSYYYDAVLWAVENGVTTGASASRFDPNGICTRAQAVTFLWRAAGSPNPETRTMPFTDVPAGSYYYDAVLWAVENGITKGTSETRFSPDDTCTRAQIVTFLWRSEKSPAAGTANPFADVKSTVYYADAVLWAVKEDITKGTTNTTFSPNADCTRAQIVTFLWRCKK